MSMNEVAMKGLLKLVKNMVPPETIKEAAESLMKSAIDFKNEIILDTEAGEITAGCFIYEVKEVVYCALVTVDDNNQIRRFVNVRPLGEIVETLIQKM